MLFFDRILLAAAIAPLLLAAGCQTTPYRAAAAFTGPPIGAFDTGAPPATRASVAGDIAHRERSHESKRPLAARPAANAPPRSALAGSIDRVGRVLLQSEGITATAPEILPTQFTESQPTSRVDRLLDETSAPPISTVPPELPGADQRPLQLPPYDANQSFEDRRRLIEGLYAPLPALPADGTVPRGTSPRPMTLLDLQQTAYDNSPSLRTAWAEVDAARGRAVQAGLCPNPTVGYEGDSLNTAGTAGYNGAYFEQTFVTAGKLCLAQQAALMDVRGKEYAYRRSRVELAANVRRAYFSVLLAQQRVRLTRALAGLMREAYERQLALVTGGQAAAYEPMQLRVLALQARNSVVTADNGYQGAWRELSAAMGVPDMPSVELAGSIEELSPVVPFDAAREAMLSRHTDLSIAQAAIAREGFNLELQRVTPIPNINVYGAVQHDDTSSLNNVSYNLQIGVPLPLFNKNQGNISAAQAEVVRARQSWVETRNDLIGRLAEIYARYASARELAATYHNEILPSQVQTFRGVSMQFREVGGNIDFAQVVVSQQTLATVVNEYLDVLGQQWQATVELSRLLQVEDLYTMDGLSLPPAIEGVPQRADPSSPADDR